MSMRKLSTSVQLLSLVFLFTVGCGNKNSVVSSEFAEVTKKLETIPEINFRKYKAIFILPSEGCGGCISGAENFLLNNYLAGHGQGFLFIVTGLSSTKAARVRFGENAMKASDVFFDYHGVYNKPPFLQEFPKVLLLNEGRITKAVEINPGSGEAVYTALDKLMKS